MRGPCASSHRSQPTSNKVVNRWGWRLRPRALECHEGKTLGIPALRRLILHANGVQHDIHQHMLGERSLGMHCSSVWQSTNPKKTFNGEKLAHVCVDTRGTPVGQVSNGNRFRTVPPMLMAWGGPWMVREALDVKDVSCKCGSRIDLLGRHRAACPRSKLGDMNVLVPAHDEGGQWPTHRCGHHPEKRSDGPRSHALGV